jgi:hypothetical protein
MRMLSFPRGVFPAVEIVITDVVPFSPGITLEGEKPHKAPLGKPEQESATAELNVPPSALTVMVNFTDCPCLTEAEAGLALTEKSIPVPLRFAECGLPEALSVMLRDPDCVPPAVGRKVMEIVQVAVAARDEGQLLLCAKGPDRLIPEIAKAVLPVLLNMIV